MNVALVRDIGEAYVRATFQGGVAEGIDLERARAQHRAYVAAFEEAGWRVHRAPIAHDLPDACFVEDQAVIFEGRALVTRSGHPGRRAEARSVAAALEALGVEVVAMEAGTLDGGDVLQVERTLFVGRSARTDDQGVEALRRRFEPLGAEVVALDGVPGLHLKCVCSTPAPGVVAVAEDELPKATIEVFAQRARLLWLPAKEAYAANLVDLGGVTLAPEGFPATHAALVAAGLRVVTVPTSEIARGDGALTCLSLRW